MKPIYTTNGTREVATFLDGIAPQLANGTQGGAVLDSIRDQVKNTAGVSVPPILDNLLGKVGEKDEGRILDAVAAGVAHFTAEHGTAPTADVVEAAIQQGTSALFGVDKSGRVLDSATSSHHDQMSLQPNRAVVAVLSAIAEAIPFAAYLPVDIASNQGKLAILSHQAGSAFGDYALGGLMDGTNAGNVYASASRFVRFDISAEPYVGKFSASNLAADQGYCDPAAAGVPVLRGRTIIYVNGIPVCTDTPSGSGANSPISGSVTLSGVDYAIVGQVTVATGAVQITSVTPDFPVGTEVIAQGFIDYESAPALIPGVQVKADVFDIYANPWRVMTSVTIDAVGQLRNELGLDADSEALMAIRTQMALERHYQALRMAYNLGKNQAVPYDFEWSVRNQQMNRSQIWQDFQAMLGKADQDMANATMDHGITHLYVGSWLAAQFMGLGANLFTPSGVAPRPSIYRVGNLFGKYEVYYSPKVVSESADLKTATMLAVGRSSQVARCPLVLGDAVAPTYLPLNMQSDLKNQSAMYARDFTVANPHRPSALGCARISLTGLMT